MTPRFFDIHSHLNDPRFDGDRNDVLERMKKRGVFAIIVGTDHKSSQDAVMMASFAGDGIHASIGVHPIDDRDERFREPLFAEIVHSDRVVAIGECGLDYSRIADVASETDEKLRQRELFEAQIDFAITNNLPLMLHVRDSHKKIADAHKDVLSILKERKKIEGDKLRGNVHFFSQTIDIAREYFDLDFTISFTGVITFSSEYNEVVREAPLDRIMTETDCPYVSPIPYRGHRNEPVYIEEVVKKIADIRGEDLETVRAQLVQNALRVFNIMA